MGFITQVVKLIVKVALGWKRQVIAHWYWAIVAWIPLRYRWNATNRNTTAYLQHWISALRQDNRLVVQAAALAQRAVDHITGQCFIKEEDGDAGEDGTPVHASIPLAA